VGLEVGQGWTGRKGGQVGRLDVGRWTGWRSDGLDVRWGWMGRINEQVRRVGWVGLVGLVGGRFFNTE